MMPLSMAKSGEVNVIQKVGGKEETRLFLEKLGFVVGSPVTVISVIAGNLIVNIKDSRVAIGKEMANKDFMDPELTEEEKRETILANEDDYLEGLLAAADNAANDTKKIEIIRNERKYFSFSIHSLTDEMLKGHPGCGRTGYAKVQGFRDLQLYYGRRQGQTVG